MLDLVELELVIILVKTSLALAVVLLALAGKIVAITSLVAVIE